MVTTIRVRNFAGVRRADLQVAPAALVVGTNFSGKSSLLQGIAAAICNQPLLRSVGAKKDAALLVRDGADGALVSVAGANGQVLMRWPGCEVETDGQAPRGNPFAVGLASVADLPPGKERAKVLVGLLKAEPTSKDLEKELTERGIREESIKKLQEIIDDNGEAGWDIALQKAKDTGTKVKSRWEDVTGEKYGVKKAEGWAPKGWEVLDDMPETLEEIDEQIAALELRVKHAETAAAATGGELAALRLELAAAREESAGLARLRERKTATDKELEDVIEKRASIRNPDTDQTSPCPHCGKPILSKKRGDSSWVHEAPVSLEDITEEQRRELRLAIAAAEGTKKRLEGEARALQDEITRAEHAGNRAARLDGRIKELEAIDSVSPADLEKARTQLHQVKAYREGLEKKQKADALHASIQANAKIQEVLKPEGLRQEKLTGALDILNQDMDELAKIGGCLSPSITGNLDILYRARPFALCSESEQWRAKTILQAALARRGHADLMVVDRFDVIQPQDQGKLMKMLTSCDIPVVIGMMRKDRAAAEAVDLAAAKMGATYWMEAGELAPIGRAAEQEAA